MDFITRLPLCANNCNAILTCVDHLTKYTVLTACTFSGGGIKCQVSSTYMFSRVLSDSLACLTTWSMTGIHILLQSSGLNSSILLDPGLSLAVLTTPKQMGKHERPAQER